MKVRFTSAAEQELAQALAFYQAAESGLAARFLDEIEAAVDRISKHPLAWAPLSARTRRCRTKRFPFGLFYQIRDNDIVVLSVMDLRRDPTRWEDYL